MNKDKNSKKKTERSRTLNALFKERSPRVRFSTGEQTLFAKRMSFLVGAGVPMLESLEILKDQARTRGATYLYTQIIADVSNGQFLSTSLAKFSRTFGVFAINIIRVGELSGTLTQNLVHLAEELRKKHALKKKVMGALVYPIIVTVATLGISILLTVYIFPKIMPIFASLNVTLPLTTRMLLALSNFLQSYGLWVFFGIIIFINAIIFARRLIPAFRFFLDGFILKLPITGKIALYYNMSNLFRTLSLLLSSGVTLSEAMKVTGESMENRTYRALCLQFSEGVLRGEKLSTNMATAPKRFPPMAYHMVGVGEKTGNLSQTLMYLSDLYEAEVEDLTKNLSSAIEPVLMVVMGLVVGFVAVSVITPIYEVTQHLQR